LRLRKGDKGGNYAPIEDEVFVVPKKFFFKLVYEKLNSDENTFISYRRIFDSSLEDCIDYKLPFTQEEKRLILTRFGSITDIARKILSIRAEFFKFKTPFKTELLIKRRISDDKSENSLFESIKDKSKFNLTIKNGVMIADDTNKSNR